MSCFSQSNIEYDHFLIFAILITKMIYLAFLWLLDRSDLGLLPFCCIVYSGLWPNSVAVLVSYRK